MDDSMKKDRQEELLEIAQSLSVCDECRGKMVYQYGGIYRCEECGKIALDDFGRIRLYIELNGPTPAVVLSECLGVPINRVNTYLREGRLEIPEGSPQYIKCEKCGCDIRYGRYCPDCVRAMAGDLRKAFFVEGAGVKPKSSGEKMHFLNSRNGGK